MPFWRSFNGHNSVNFGREPETKKSKKHSSKRFSHKPKKKKNNNNNNNNTNNKTNKQKTKQKLKRKKKKRCGVACEMNRLFGIGRQTYNLLRHLSTQK